jgi:hypothetical protein
MMAGAEARPTIKLVLVGRSSLAASNLSGQKEKEKKRIRMVPNFYPLFPFSPFPLFPSS